MKWIMFAWIMIFSETVSAQNCVEEEHDKKSDDCVSEVEKLDPIGQKITNILSPENEENIIKKGKEEEKRNKGFRSTTPSEEKVALSIWKKLRVLPCKQNCGTFSPTWKTSFDTAVTLFNQLETTDHVKTDFKTFVKIGEQVLELLYEKKEVNENLVKSAYLKAMKLRNDTDGINVDPGQIFPALGDETGQNTTAGIDYADQAVGETAWKDLKKLPSRVAAPEDKLDYFREDTRLHIFHDNFHSLNFGMNEDPRPRQNEFFFYLHRLLLFRYLTERDTEGLPETSPFNKTNRLTQFRSDYSLTPETDPSNLMSSFSSNKPTCQLAPKSIEFLEKTEKNCDSVIGGQDSERFGQYCMSYHDNGHRFISEDCKVEPGRGKNGIMLDSSSSARDPLFYRWHGEIDEKYEKFLMAQPPYTRKDILPPKGLTVASIQLQSRCKQPNQIETFWEVKGAENQLNHMAYQIKISLQNAEGIAKKVTVRVYLVKEKFVSDNKYYFELDRFTYKLSGAKQEDILRFDNQSSLVWRKKDECGWPSSLALPKGKSDIPEKYRLVVFLNELVDQTITEGEGNEPTMLCGPRQGESDPKHTGWPLQRRWEGVNKLDVVNNKDSSFGKISAVVEILNRGSNPTGCEHAKFTGSVSIPAPPSSETPPSTNSPAGAKPEGSTKPAPIDVPRDGVQICDKQICFMMSATPIDDQTKADLFCQINKRKLTRQTEITHIVKKARSLLKNKKAMFWTGIRQKTSCKIILRTYRGNKLGFSWAMCKKPKWATTGNIYALCDPK